MPKQVLTLANETEAASTTQLGGDGHGTEHLKSDPLARDQYDRHVKHRQVDAVHLSRFDGTKLVQWFGRGSSGYYYPLGSVMKIVEVMDDA